MLTRHYACVLAFLLSFSGVSAEAQNVFALPGSNGLTGTTAVYNASSLAAAGSFLGNPAAYLALATPSGNKFYIVSTGGGNNLFVVDNTFSSPRSLGSLGQATGAIITPDGRRLFIAAGALFAFDTTTDAPLFGGGLNVANAVDVSASLDGTRVFVLSSSSVTAVDPNSGQTLGSVNLPAGSATGISTAPNGLVYASVQNAIVEIDPKSVTIRTQIPAAGLPGKLTFTADGKLGLAVNQSPFNGPALFAFDLVNRQPSASIQLSSFPNTAVLTKVFPVANNRVLALGSQGQAQTLFDITLSPLSVTTFPTTAAGGVSAAATSNDIATPAHPGTQFVFFTSGSTLFKYDLLANQLAGQVTMSSPEGALSYTSAAATGTPVTLLSYGDNQTVPASGTSAPLVVRALDGQGRPLANVTVSFTTTTIGASLQNTSATTSNDGFATTTLIAPASQGIVNVSAAAPGGVSASFTVNVGAASSGGGGGAGGGLTIVGGQGQVIPEQNSTSFFQNSLIVQATDTIGHPVPGAGITFAITQGSGSLFGGAPDATIPNALDVTTDSNGKAAVDFQSASLNNQFVPFAQTTITASTSSGATATFYITTVPFNSAPTYLLTKPDFGQAVQGQLGQTLQGAIQAQVVALNGQVIPNVSLRIENPPDPATGPSAACAGIFALTDSTGTATCNLVLSGRPGTIQVTPNLGYSQDMRPVTVTITPGGPSSIQIVQGDKQSGKPGDTVPLIIQVNDPSGTALPGVSVAWRAASSGVTLSQVVATTDANGRASAVATLGNAPGPQQVTVTVGTIVQTINLTTVIPAAGLKAVSGTGQTTPINTPFSAPLVVNVTDVQGKPLQGSQVTFAVTSGSATVGSPAALTDAQGNASTTVQAGSGAGPVTVTATVGAFTATFSLTAILPGPTNLTFVNGASFQPGISPGSIATINGSGIANGIQGVVTPGPLIGPLPNTLAGVSVTFNGTPAPIYSVSNIGGVQQVTVQVPFEVSAGTATVSVTGAGGGISTVNNVAIQPFSPGIFEVGGPGDVAALVRPDGSFVNAGNPIQRGEVVRMYVTGLGQVGPTATGTNRAGVPNQDVTANLTVGVNNAGVQLVSARLVPGVVGVYEVALQVPADTATGPSQPLGLFLKDSAGNQYTAQNTFAPIQ